MTQYVLLSADATTVVSWFAGPQPAQTNYAEIADTDARYLAWQAVQSAQQAYGRAMLAGVQITSLSTSAINGIYGISPQTQGNITAEQLYIATKSTFSNGQMTRNWPDAAGAMHLFPSPGVFTVFAEAIAQYVDALAAALATVQGGGAWSAPSASVTIA
jgi:hypothetical protein